MSGLPIPTIHERAGRQLSLKEIAEYFAAIAVPGGANDLFVVLCGPVDAEGTFERTAFQNAADCFKLARVMAAMIRQNWPEEAMALLVREMYELKPDPATQTTVLDPWEWVN
jgi:hypothetical protein